jgi:hypothetical protein
MSALIELLEKTRLSPEQIARRAKIDPRTVRKHAEEGTMTASLRKKLRPLTRQSQKSLVSEVGNIILENYREYKDRHLHPCDDDLLQFIDDHLIIIPRLQWENEYEWSELQYVLAHLFYSRAFHGRWNNRDVDGEARNVAASEAENLYTTAAQMVRSLDPLSLTDQQKANQTAFAELLDLNAMETKWQKAKRPRWGSKDDLQARRLSRSRCLDELDAQDILGRLRAALSTPHNAGVWTIPHNGLVFGSLLNRYEDMKFFHEKLVEVQPGFRSWDFTPGETPTLRSDDDLANFRQAFPHLDTNPTSQENSMTTKISSALCALMIGTTVFALIEFALTTAAHASNM